MSKRNDEMNRAVDSARRYFAALERRSKMTEEELIRNYGPSMGSTGLSEHWAYSIILMMDDKARELRKLVEKAYKEGLEYGSYKHLEIRNDPMAGWEDSKSKKRLG